MDLPRAQQSAVHQVCMDQALGQTLQLPDLSILPVAERMYLVKRLVKQAFYGVFWAALLPGFKIDCLKLSGCIYISGKVLGFQACY